MKEVFEIQNPAYNFHSEATHLNRENVKTTHYSIQSVRHLGPKLPNNIKNFRSLNKFKNSIKSWKPNECPCRLCKKYIAQVGFIWFISTFCYRFEETVMVSAETVHFPGFPHWEIGWSFCILCCGCHYLLCFISLFVYYYFFGWR